ncbi:MAG TPA: NAD(P)H-dependent glycerol-3-phosphate dehydrogenase [Candidatus Latescibacteria bacterium]|nr:NAD(P)H-dependent glycerol-3-phosphate dehydrogenase [Candidatus Latescibacterota bacterium]
MNIAVIGAGGWGTTLAILLHENGNLVRLWEFDPGYARQMVKTRHNPAFLPGVRIPEEILISSDMAEVLSGSNMVVFAVPSEFMRDVAKKAAPCFAEDAGLACEVSPLVVSVAKGIENETLRRMSEVLAEELPVKPDQIVALSGPSHAEEVSRKIPTTVVAASSSLEFAGKVQSTFMTSTLRVYTNRDIVGVELGGSLKNVIALAAGICDGLGFGDNTKGALITRGLAEITRLGVAMGADPLTFAGLSGMGDLITTCISRHSRNRYVGEQIGQGRRLNEILAGMKMVAEGVRTTRSAFQLSRKMGVEMPITEKVYRVLFQNEDPKIAVAELMTREAKPEVWWSPHG